ncbi:hypothetical protein [Halovenus salina]|uniref:Uncharacterized protein n=1 Tax=Halovenus salina TaxID=1510225 RepID=A0ABD5W334_9EURY|nr:hypothetical protein [Halovenus salina]
MVDEVILGAIGVGITLFGIAIVGERTGLLTHYPDDSGPARLRYGAGGTVLGYGILTVGTAVGLVATDWTALLWGGWAAVTVLVGFGVAGFAAAVDSS